MSELKNERPLMIKNIDGDKCPKCGAVEVEAMTARTVYECGSSDYDQRPNTFKQSEKCEELLVLFSVSQQRELLIAYENKVGHSSKLDAEIFVDKYLKDIGN